MTYTLTAHTHDHARLIVSETRTTDKAVADLAKAYLENAGYIVSERKES